MLKQMMELIEKEGVVQPARLAMELDTSLELVEQALDHLRRLGYLKAVDGCSEGQCHGCASPPVCSAGKPRLWNLRGDRA